MFGRHELKLFFSRQLRRLLEIVLHSLSFRLFLLGFLLGPIALAIFHHHQATVGQLLPARTGGLIAIALALAWAASRGFLPITFPRRGWLQRVIPVWIQATLGLVLWVVLLPYITGLHELILKQFSSKSLQSSSIQTVYYSIVGLVSLGFPAYWLVRAADALSGDLVRTEVNEHGRVQYQRYLLRYGTGLVSGIVFTSLLFAPLLGLQIVAWCSATLIVVVCIERLVQGGAVQSLQSPFRFRALLQDERSPWTEKIWQMAVWASLGGMIFLLQRMFSQYMPGTIYVASFVWIGFAIGFLWGVQFIATRQGDTHQAQEKVASLLLLTLVGASAWSVLWMLASDGLIAGSLWISAYWSQAWLITLVRLCCIVLAVAPLGLTAVCTLLTSQQAASINLISCCRWHRIGGLVVGCIAVQWLLTEGITYVTLVTACQWMLLSLAGLKWAQTWKFSYSKPVVVGLCASVLLVLAAPLADRMFDSGRTAKYLFSSDVYAAYRTGTDQQELGVLNDSRLLKQFEGESATYTVWSQNGLQQVIRADGLPQGISSLDSRIIPEQTAEILLTVFPLSLHRTPHQVMLLGAPSGVAVKSCLQFPVQQLTCVEPEKVLLDLSRESSWKMQSPEEDVRFAVQDLPPQLALEKTEPQDVIISNPPISLLGRSTSYFTLEFYQAAAGALNEEGIFCQRFQHFDYGSQPLCDIVATLRSAFRSVCTIQSAQGEVLLIGSNSEAGVDRDGFLSRLRKPHSRQALASLGWDWAVPLEIFQIDDEAWTEILEQQPGRINTAANGRLAYTLPHEMLRWGNKVQELQSLTLPHSDTVYAWVEDEDNDHQVSHRFKELKSMRELQVTSNGKYWTYRPVVRNQVQQKPRTVIQQVKGEGQQERLHEEDRRRLEYFKSLGSAFQSHELTVEQLVEVEQFSQPYDPLVTYFSHMELAALCKREPEKFSGEELRHLLYTVFYGASQDRSIKNIARATTLLVEYPEVINDEPRRADLLNAMLQMMKSRWMLRGQMPVGSLGLSQKDVTDSLEAIELTFAEFDKFAAHPELKDYPWEDRQHHIERFLVSPLRTYRSQLSIAQAKREHDRETNEAQDANDTLQQEVKADEARQAQEKTNPLSNAVFEVPGF
ncbi:MAG: methyltransferase [Planctomycetaceae bacterium]|nr:methyltransferase [Planctomycetaceae bacterium]